jgi:hypothetical protein
MNSGRPGVNRFELSGSRAEARVGFPARGDKLPEGGGCCRSPQRGGRVRRVLSGEFETGNDENAPDSDFVLWREEIVEFPTKCYPFRQKLLEISPILVKIYQ